jgi:ubiquinone/menaquinone biosynthesis C-methylase UbiE
MSKDNLYILGSIEIANAFNESMQTEDTTDTWIKWHANLESWVDQAIDKTKRQIENQEYQQFLDVGTGTGNNVIFLSETYPTCSFDACDISSLYIEKAKNTISKKRIDNITFAISDAHHLLYKDATYDIVTCFFSLMYFNNVYQSIQEFIRVSKPKGKIIITTWGGDNLVFKTIMQLLSIDENSTYVDLKNPNLFSEEKELLKLFSQYNFSDIAIERHQTNIQWIGNSDTFWLYFKESNPSIEKTLILLETIQRQEKEQEILKVLSKFEKNGVLFLPTTILISVLKKS